MAEGSIYETGEYVRENSDWHASDSPWKAANICKMLERNGLRPRSICDVGCGVGEVLRHIPAEIKVGYDLAPLAIERARLGGGDYRLGFPDQRFDLALAVDVFEHIDDYYGFLRQMRTYAPLQMYHIPLDLSVLGLMRNQVFMASSRSAGHLHFFSKDTALVTLERTGHTVIDWFYTCGSIDVPKGRKQKIAAPIRKALFSASPDWTARVIGGFSMMALCRDSDRSGEPPYGSD